MWKHPGDSVAPTSRPGVDLIWDNPPYTAPEMKAGPTVALLKCPRIHQPKLPTCIGKFRDFPLARSTSSPRRIILRASGHHHFKLRETSLELSLITWALIQKFHVWLKWFTPTLLGCFYMFFITTLCPFNHTQLFRFQFRARSVFCALWHSVESPLRCFCPSPCSMWVGNHGNPASNVEILNEYCTYYTTSTNNIRGMGLLYNGGWLDDSMKNSGIHRNMTEDCVVFWILL